MLVRTLNVEAHRRVEAQRPEHADADRDEDQQRLADRAEHPVERRQRDDQDRRRQVSRVRDRDAVVGLADLETAVVVRLEAGGHARARRRSRMSSSTWPRTSSMRSSSKVTTTAVTVPSSETRSPRSSGSSSASLPDQRRRCSCVLDRGLRAAASPRCRHRRPRVGGEWPDDVGGGQTLHALDALDALEVAGDAVDVTGGLRA